MWFHIPAEYRVSNVKAELEQEREFLVIYIILLLLMLWLAWILEHWKFPEFTEDFTNASFAKFQSGGVPGGSTQFIAGGEPGGPGHGVGKPGMGKPGGGSAAGGKGGNSLVDVISSRSVGNSSLSRIFGKTGLGSGIGGALKGVGRGSGQGTDQEGGVGGGGGIGSSRARGFGAGEIGDGVGVGGVGKGQLGTGYGGGTGAIDLGMRSERKVFARIAEGETTVKGFLDPALIQAVVRDNLASIRYCYEKELNRDPKLAGKIIVQFIIDLSGTVTEAKVENSMMKDPIVEDCITRRIKRWRFPKPQGGDVVVSYPFVFSSGQ